VGLAVNVTVFPAQIFVDDALIIRAGVTGCVTVIVITFEFAVVLLAQPALDVSWQLTWSPVTNVFVE
jgi:hypothetical protein